MDAKKKKNKKKKGNQNKTVEDAATSNPTEVVLQEPNNGCVVDENHSVHSSSNVDFQTFGSLESDMELEKQKAEEAEFIKLQEVVKLLEDERNSWLQKQVTYEETINVLQKEVNLFVQKESALEQNFKEFQLANDSLLHNQAILEDKIKKANDLKDSLILKESLLKEMIAKVEEVNTTFQVQVKQLDLSRNNMLEENQRLMETITLLHMRIQSLEKDFLLHGKSTELNKHFEGQTILEKIGVDAMVEKQIDKNSELTGKVSETYTEGRHGEVADHTSNFAVNQNWMSKGDLTPTKHKLEYLDGRFESAEKANSPVGIMNAKNVIDDFVSESMVISRPSPQSGDPRINDEIVTVPLDEIQTREDDSLKEKNDDKSESLPLSDAPLSGAPFRLISFLAKYVSGSDLVNLKRADH